MPGAGTHAVSGTEAAGSFSMQGPMVALLTPFKPSEMIILLCCCSICGKEASEMLLSMGTSAAA